MSYSRSVSCIVLIFCLFLVGLATGALGQATVETDKEDYEPGETVFIMGNGWLPGEEVQLQIYRMHGELLGDTLNFLGNDPEDVDTTLYSFADETGYFLNDEFVPQPEDTNTAFYVLAEGQTSSWTAGTHFYDHWVHYLSWVRVGSQSPDPVRASQSATYSVTAKSPWHCFMSVCHCAAASAYLDIATSLPPGVTYTFSPSSVYTGDPSCQAYASLTIYTSLGTPPGLYELTVRASVWVWWAWAYWYDTIYLSVTPYDVTPPVADVDPLPVVSGECSATITTYPTATDDVDGVRTGTTTDPLTYDAQGTYTVEWTYTDESGNSSYQDQTVIVQDISPPSLIVPPNVQGYTGPGATACGTIVDEATLGTATAFDNCGGPVSISRSELPPGNLFPVGVTSISYTATDHVGNVTTGTQLVTVYDNTPPVITHADVTTMTDYDACSKMLMFTPQVSDNCPGVTYEPMSGSHTVGSHQVTLTARDAAANTSTCQFNVTVENPPPVVSITGPPSGDIYAVGTPVGFTATFSDDNGGTHSALWTCNEDIEIEGTVDDDAGTVTASYTFQSAGVYLVTLTVTDQCDDTGTANTVDSLEAMVVVYDPTAGFVTGGGWINSPTGAYTTDPDLVGKANFGFVSKYEKGTTEPTGQTEFRFKVADLNFHSTDYDWLVIAGAKAQYKGSGTINGGGDYGFTLTATDGEVNGGGDEDKFRMKIVDRALDLVVYDNQMGGGIDDDPVTTLGGGSIVVHNAKDGGAASSGGPGTAMGDEPDLIPSSPTRFALFQNQPNPFNPTTTIRFEIPVSSKVNLAIYDVSGRLVRRLLDTTLPAGRHSATWHGRSDTGGAVSSGVYFYRIHAGDFTETKRMVFLK